jgi:hypothetical protein
MPGFAGRASVYFAGDPAGDGAGAGVVVAGAVRVWPTVLPALLLADWLESRGHRNNAPMIRIAATTMAAIAPVLIPRRVPIVLRLSKSSLISGLH